MMSTPDLSDLNPDARQLPYQFRCFGLRAALSGPVATISCFEDTSRVKEAAAEPGRERVLLIDGGGSLTRALSGDQVAKTAMDNGWAGMVIIGAVRDVEIINTFDFCVLALGTSPIKTQKLGQGDRGAALSLGGVPVSEGDFLAGDQNGVLVLDRAFNVL